MLKGYFTDKLCINRNPVVSLNDRASLPHFSLRRESSAFLWCKKKKEIQSFPFSGRGGKYYWVSIYTKLNANRWSTPLTVIRCHGQHVGAYWWWSSNEVLSSVLQDPHRLRPAADEEGVENLHPLVGPSAVAHPGKTRTRTHIIGGGRRYQLI